MNVLLLQTLLLLACGPLLFLLFRSSTGPSSAVRNIVAAGFLSRAVAGQVLFWTSYLRLPFVRNLQEGDGFWFFAVDSRHYHAEAIEFARGGVQAIAAIPKSIPSPAFVQMLSVFSYLFGTSPATGLLLNLFSYLGCCYIIVRCSDTPARKPAMLLAVGAISLSPGGILWSLQPLKDTYFVFLIVAVVGACAGWQCAAREGRIQRAVLPSLVLSLAIYLTSGIRWYMAFAELVAVLTFLILVVITSPRRWFATGVAIVSFELFGLAFVAGGGPYIPNQLRRVLAPTTFSHEIGTLPRFLATELGAVRKGFEQTPARTMIGAGKLLARNESPSGEKISTGARGSSKSPPPTSVLPPGESAQRASVAHLKETPRHASVPPSRKSSRQASLTPPNENSPHARAPLSRSTAADEITLPPSTLGRMVTGAVAVAIPRSIAQAAGLIEIRGGRGLMFFTELDTLAFDSVLLAAIMWIALARRASLKTPLFWFLALLAAFVGGPLLYAVTNFGSLFRLREMVYVVVALIPFGIVSSPQASAETQSAEPTPMSGVEQAP
ncbi:MAG TPA: hypothetical protein VHL58_16900 [Thermoanaerobaculia bacterium]|nr:hypothetical protein [Thermoanaerobaculia bacterium]